MDPLRRFGYFKQYPELERCLNLMVDRLNSLLPRGGPGVKVRHTSNGASFEADIPRRVSSSSNVSLYRISAVAADYLTCFEITYDAAGVATLATTATKVAKPYYLRVTPFITGSITFPNNDGNTRRTTGTFAGVANVHLDEFMTPAYAIGDEIMGADVGQTGIVGAAVEDVNADDRGWRFAKQFVKVCILVNGVATTKNMQIYGSAVF